VILSGTEIYKAPVLINAYEEIDVTVYSSESTVTTSGISTILSEP
jgi:hypothetical protein